jgi:hypothetical protein
MRWSKRAHARELIYLPASDTHITSSPAFQHEKATHVQATSFRRARKYGKLRFIPPQESVYTQSLRGLDSHFLCCLCYMISLAASESALRVPPTADMKSEIGYDMSREVHICASCHLGCLRGTFVRTKKKTKQDLEQGILVLQTACRTTPH